jgi:hypothetical protein
MLNYHSTQDNLILTELDEDVTNKEPSGEFILGHTKRLIHFPKEWMDNYNNYLENGLFLGIFPPQMVQDEIDNYWKIQNEWMEESLKTSERLHTQIWTENDFKKCFEDKISLKRLLILLKDINKRREKYHNLRPIDIEKEYKKYLIKYWGDWKIDE